MEVAVIIPLFNGARWIRATLASALRQNHPAAEILVVDDGSTDRSPEIVKEFPGVRLVRNPTKGANAARKFGCAGTRSPLIALLDQDDIWHPGHLRQLAAWLEARPACRAVAAAECDFGRQNPRVTWSPGETRREKFDAWKNFPFGPRVGSPSAVMMRRTCLEEIGGWPTEFPGMADYFAWLGLSANGTPLGGMARSLACTMARRRHPQSYSSALRTGDALAGYADALHRASCEAARRFGPKCSLDEPALARRLEMAGNLQKIVTAFLARDWAAFSSCARDSWQRLQEEPADLRKKFGGMVSWLLDGRRPLGEALALYDQARACWPEEDGYTREILKKRRDIYAAKKPVELLS